MESSGGAPGPGWYPDPNDPATNRYWDGAKWTDSRAPRQLPGTAAGEKEQEATGVIIAGYIFAILMPIVGFIIGLTQVNRNRHGLWVVIASVVAFVLWLAVVGAMNESESSGGYYS